MLTHISRIAGGRYFEHVGQGSWKAWRAAASRRRRGLSRALHLQLDPHELRLALFVATLVLVAGAAAAHRLSPRCRQGAESVGAAGSALVQRAKANLGRPAVLRRALQVSAVLVLLSGLRATAGPRCLNPWRVVGFWLALLDASGEAPPLDSATRTRLRRSEQLAVVGCGRAIHTALAFNGVIDAVEEFGALFSNYSVHLLLTLPPHEPTPRISAAHAGRRGCERRM